MNSPLATAFACFALLASLLSNNQRHCFVVDAERATGTANDPEEKLCSIYLAPSSLKGNPGFGVFTTRDISRQEPVLTGPDGPSVVVIDQGRNVPGTIRAAQRAQEELWGNYWWGRGVPDHVSFEGDEVFDFQGTFGALPNHHCILSAVDHVYPEAPYEDSLLNRYKDPGAGAFSYHRGRIFHAVRNLSAGSEIFLNYGYCGSSGQVDENGDDEEEESLHYPPWARSLPMVSDYHDATHAIRDLWRRLIKEYEGVKNIPDDLEFDPSSEMAIPVSQLIPRNITMLRRIMTHPSALTGAYGDIFFQVLAAELLTDPRASEWIRENGLCIEHLVPAPSTLPQAGQGGFAQHRLKAGEMIVPAPLLQIIDRDVLTVFNDSAERVGKQLLLNYCFSHRNTSLALCPDTNAILVNHCSDRTKECGPKGPNAMFRWASGWDPVSDDWLNKTVDDIAKEDGRGLSMEIVALRDIEPGEEVFMDYGAEWEEAWAKHVKGWKPPEEEESYESVKELNTNEHGLDSFVSDDLRFEIDHPHLFSACAYWPTEFDDDEVWQEKDMALENMSNEELLEKLSDDGSIYKENYLTHPDGAYWPCHLLLKEDHSVDDGEDGGDKASREDHPVTYTVRILQREHSEHGEMPWAENEMPRYLTNYPKESIRIFPKPYSSDQHLPNAFRYYIPIPDDTLPDQWKNLKDGVRQTTKRIVPAVRRGHQPLETEPTIVAPEL